VVDEATDIGEALGRLLTAYERLAHARRRALDLNTNEEAALQLVGQGVTAPSALSRALGMTTAGVTNMLDRLEASGHLRRDPHQTDRRRVLLTLTKLGFAAQLELETMHAQVARLAGAGGASHDVVLGFLDAAAGLVEDAAMRRED
jgi:DNA-binding MarR family transcriptional regulator